MGEYTVGRQGDVTGLTQADAQSACGDKSQDSTETGEADEKAYAQRVSAETAR